jgi:hypothetical protein
VISVQSALTVALSRGVPQRLDGGLGEEGQERQLRSRAFEELGLGRGAQPTDAGDVDLDDRRQLR